MGQSNLEASHNTRDKGVCHTLRDYLSGKPLEKEDVDKMLDSYYEERGWDIEKDLPAREKLMEVGLDTVAGDMEKAMDMTLSEVRGLNRFSDLSFNIFLLEPKDEKYVNAARKIAREGFGKVVVADPGELASKMLGSYRSEGRLRSGV